MAIGIGTRIKMTRLQQGMTQLELAKKMGYKSKAAICKVETGDDNLTSDRVKLFADALNVTPGYLMGWERKDGEPKAPEHIELSKHAKVIMAYATLDPSVQKVVDKILGLDGDD